MSTNLTNKVSQEAFDKILSTPASHRNVSALLQAAGFSTELDSLYIHLDDPQSIDFSGCQFEKVTLTGHFEHTRFDNVTMNNTIFYNAELNASEFHGANLNHTSFIESTLDHVTFENTDFNLGTFYQTQISHTNIFDTSLDSTSIINSNIQHSKIWDTEFVNNYIGSSNFSKVVFSQTGFDGVLNENSNMTDMHVVFTQDFELWDVFFEAEQHYVMPEILLVGDTQWHSAPERAVAHYNGQPFTISQYMYDSAFDTELSREVRQAINSLDSESDWSIAKQVLYSDQPTINQIKNYGYELMLHYDALLLPGGPDVHPEFYGETNTFSGPSNSYYREVLEFSLLDAAVALDKPIMGICHGSQVTNVYLGGTLHQHVEGQFGIDPLLDVHTREGLIGSVLEETAIAPSYHHQAVKDVAPSLEVVATYQGVIKATQANDDKKIMLTQFHPEYEADQSSKNILRLFMTLSSESKKKSAVIEIGDVLDLETSFASGLPSTHANYLIPSQPLHALPEIIYSEDHVMAFA